jgi:methionyl aminopeptidase
MIPIKSEKELNIMREAGKILGKVMKELRRSVKAGISSKEIDEITERLILSESALPAFKGYKGFPASACVSVNEEIVHGIPDDRKLKDKDIVSLDVGINYQGYFCDAAITLPVGNVDAKAKKLIDTTKAALAEGIKHARANNFLSDVSFAIQNYVEKKGFSVVREFVGHGIGSSLHEEPEIPNFGRPHQGPLLRAGMVLAIEPMVNMGKWESRILDNGWTAVTKDGLPSAHFEHTVAITEKGPEVLTN